ncbi:MAG: TetR/AcrR family transcriptional regulator [Acidobacteriota bacterium]|nr:TetR/AcrR family transcriptional regulator [Acidobacteriota bacterium]
MSAARQRTRHDVLSEFRSAEIMAAARSVFAAKGFADATVDEIAQVAGVAKGTLYLYYRSKRAIYLASVRSGLEQLLARLRDELAGVSTVKDRIRAFVRTRLTYFDEHRDFFRIYYSEFTNLLNVLPASQRFVREMYEQQIAMLAAAIDGASDRGAMRPLDAGKVALVIAELTRGLNGERALRGSTRTVDEEVVFVVDLIWNGLER